MFLGFSEEITTFHWEDEGVVIDRKKNFYDLAKLLNIMYKPLKIDIAMDNISRLNVLAINV